MGSLGRNAKAYERFTAAVDVPMTVLALLWLPFLIIPYVMTLSPSVSDSFFVVDFVIWACFVVEYLVRLYLVPERGHFFTHHLLDLAVIALPMLRPLRALRLLRLLELGRVGVVLANALRRTRQLLTHRGLHFVLLAVVAIVFAGSAMVLLFERNAHGSNIHDYGQALWWAVVTITTVGYGDRFPVTPGGQGVAVILMLTGIGLIGVLTATVASFFVEQRVDQDKAELHDRLERIEAALAVLIERTGGDEGEITRIGASLPFAAQADEFLAE